MEKIKWYEGLRNKEGMKQSPLIAFIVYKLHVTKSRKKFLDDFSDVSKLIEGIKPELNGPAKAGAYVKQKD
jgi:hypothetical protein